MSATPFPIINDTSARRSYKVKMDNQDGEPLRLTLKERDAGAAVLGRAFTEYEMFPYYFHDVTERRAAE
jgi:hypothetical protein